MKFIELARKRQSDRKYLNKAVPRQKVESCIEAARIAPSASNSQPWKFIVIDDPALKDSIAKETYNKVVSFNRFVRQAAVIVVLVIEKPKLITQIGGRIKNKEYPLIDIGIAAEHFCLQAAEEGLGTCMIGWFNENRIKDLLSVPGSKRIGLLISLGYPAISETRTKKRKHLSEIMAYNRYSQENQ